MRIRDFLGMVFLCFAAMPASASEGPSLFGIALGKPLSLARCLTDPTVGEGPASMCWWTASEAVPPEGRLDISFGRSYPKYLYSDLLMVEMSNGVVSRISVVTDGVEVQGLVAGLLRQKFGAPEASLLHKYKNGFGGAFDSMSQHWSFKTGGDLQFDGTLDVPDRGKVVMRGKTAVKYDADAARQALGRPL